MFLNIAQYIYLSKSTESNLLNIKLLVASGGIAFQPIEPGALDGRTAEKRDIAFARHIKHLAAGELKQCGARGKLRQRRNRVGIYIMRADALAGVAPIEPVAKTRSYCKGTGGKARPAYTLKNGKSL